MGTDRWSDNDWSSYQTTHIANKTTSQIFTSRSLKNDLDPKGTAFRESCDSDINPNSTPIILAFDVTGSMGHIAHEMAKEGIKTTIEEILNRKPVSDPHIMVMGVGDAWCDSAPLQVSQFEADTKIIEQLSQIYIEGGGGGNDKESYNMPWYFAAAKTKIDCVKRGKKGILFTMGDDKPPAVLLKEHVKEFIGDDIESDIKSRDLLDLVSLNYDVFHLVIEEGDCCRGGADHVIQPWNALLGKERVIPVKDHTKIPEIIVSTLQVLAGDNADDVVKSWDGTTAVAVAHAVKDVARGRKNNNGGVLKF
jgi:hypothetical protein